MFQTLNAIAQGCRSNPGPMGGLQIILTGDFFQLPPISNIKGKGNFKNNSIDFSLSQKDEYPNTQLISSPKKNQTQKTFSTDKISNFFQPTNKSKNNFDGNSSQISGINNALEEKTMTFSQQAKEYNTTILRFCFQSPVWNIIIGENTFKLTNVFRQSDTVFASLLNSIRYGELSGMFQTQRVRSVNIKSFIFGSEFIF